MVFELEFNCIYIIQSLPDNETQTGSKLFDDIIIRTFQFEHLSAKLVNVSSSRELHQAFYNLNEAIFEEGLFPYLHFEIHGSKDGLVLKNGELIRWKSLRPTLSTINYNTENNLFVSLATCYGAFLFSAADMLERVPFLGLIGPALEITIGDVEKDWGTYFDILLSSKSFYGAIISLNKSNDRVSYKFFSAEQIWEIYCNAYLEMFSSREEKRAKLLSLHRNSKNFPGLQNFSHAERDAIFKTYISNQKFIMEGFKEYFLMRTDKQPF